MRNKQKCAKGSLLRVDLFETPRATFYRDLGLLRNLELLLNLVVYKCVCCVEGIYYFSSDKIITVPVYVIKPIVLIPKVQYYQEHMILNQKSVENDSD